MFYIGLYRENVKKSSPLPKLFKWLILGKCEKIFLSETTMPRALIFGMKHYLEDLYQVCSNYIPGAKNAPPPHPGVKCFT